VDEERLLDARLEELKQAALYTINSPGYALSTYSAATAVYSVPALVDEVRRLRQSLVTEKALTAMHVEAQNDLEDKVERLRVLLAWEAAELSEGQAARALSTDRVTLRGYREDEISLARSG
jgi:hypothetical protein